MITPSPSVRALAERLLAIEDAHCSASESDTLAALQVSEKLRTSLSQFVGVDGFIALQRRALALARADVPSLQAVRVGSDGRLEGLEEVGEHREAGTAMTAHLLGLLMTFIGGPLALRLIRDAFPDASVQALSEPEGS